MLGTVPRALARLILDRAVGGADSVRLTSCQDAPESAETIRPATGDQLPIPVSFAIPRVGPKDLVSGERLMG
jgi:hypothetical protein